MGSPRTMPKISSKISPKTTLKPQSDSIAVDTGPIDPRLVVKQLHDWNVVALPRPEREPDGNLQFSGAVWYLGLTNDQTVKLQEVLTAGGGTLAAVPGFQLIGGALLAAVPWIEAVNDLGGDNGVDINGVVGTLGVIVTPRVGKIYGELINLARMGVSGRTIMDFIVRAAANSPQLSSALNLGIVGAIFQQVAAGTPLGWAIAGGVGWLVQLFQPEPDPNQFGAVLADRRDPFAWESFILGQLGSGNQVSLLSHMGLFSAQMGGGYGVYANRPQVGEWETWTLITNGDGTVSLQTFNGHYLCAEEGGGRECQANRTAIGPWEKFFLVNLPDGRIALKTLDKGLFVSVQKG